MKKTKRRLSLDLESIRVLNEATLITIAGGHPPTRSCRPPSAQSNESQAGL